jgi:hypothetical protein
MAGGIIGAAIGIAGGAVGTYFSIKNTRGPPGTPVNGSSIHCHVDRRHAVSRPTLLVAKSLSLAHMDSLCCYSAVGDYFSQSKAASHKVGGAGHSAILKHKEKVPGKR